LVSGLHLDTHLQNYFSFISFRDGQREAILSLLNNKDCLCVLPTGAGKSLIYQFIATTLKNGIVLVISPLVSLMKDQVDSLNRFGIPAVYCNSSQDEVEQLQSLSKAVQGKVKLLYVSPERALSSYFLNMAKKMEIKLLAIDEAHCISQWGHDFRVEYSNLYKIRKELNFQKFPIIALTATATTKVKTDIVDSLSLIEPQIVSNTFLRKNLYFSVEYYETDIYKNERLLEILNGEINGRIIIYCSTRKKVDEVYDFLKSNGYNAAKYHAGQKDLTRNKTQNSYSLGKVKILVATNAFGMGIDNSDVRYVIHYQVPSSIESYYQEAGRAGRDGLISKCILFYKNSDFNVRRYLSSNSKDKEDKSVLLEEIKKYCLTSSCRQIYICNYFGEEIANCKVCDNCKSENKGLKETLEKEYRKRILKEEKSNYNFSDAELHLILNFLKENPGKFGKKIIIGVLKGSKASEILRRKLYLDKNFGCLSSISDVALQKKIENLIESNEIKVTKGKYTKLYLKSHPPISKKRILTSKTKNNNSLLKELKNFRDRESKKLKWKKYMVLQNSVILRISIQKPKTESDLLLVKGIGMEKVKKFGNQILQIIRKNETV
jgi:ATP-dependent DNA helicase RecQ